MNSWSKWLWMENVGCAAGSVRCPGIGPSWRLTCKCSLRWSTWCAFLGIDVNIKDHRGLTALDTVRELPSQKSQQIAALIEGIRPPPCWGHEDTRHAGQTMAFVFGAAFCFCFLSFHVDHMTGKRSVKEVEKTLTPQPPLISNVDSISQKSQGKAALLWRCAH